MAMVKCSECGKNVSSKAKACPNCGAPLGVGRTHISTGKGCLAVIIISIVLFVFIYNSADDGSKSSSSKQPSTPSTSSKSDSGDVHGAWAYMQLFVEKRLKSPKSADFPFGGSRHVTNLGGGRYKVVSYVDAQNAYGADIRTNFEGVIKRVNDGWELEYLNLK